MKMKALTVLLLVLFASSAFAAIKRDEPAPPFSLKDSAGKDFHLSDVVGPASTGKANGVILSFFASWCVPCRLELPLIDSVVDEMKGKGIRVVIVGFREDFDRITALLAELKVSKPLVLSDPKGLVGEDYGIRFLPVTYFIGKDGKVKDVVYGEISTEKELKEHASKLVP